MIRSEDCVIIGSDFFEDEIPCGCFVEYVRVIIFWDSFSFDNS